MRNTLRLVGQLVSNVKRLTARPVRTLGGVVKELRPKMLARPERTADRPSIHLTTVSGTGLMPGVDLDDSAVLPDLMFTEGVSGGR